MSLSTSVDRQPSIPLGNYAIFLGGNTHPMVCSYAWDMRCPATHRRPCVVVGMVYWDMYMNIDQITVLSLLCSIYVYYYYLYPTNQFQVGMSGIE